MKTKKGTGQEDIHQVQERRLTVDLPDISDLVAYAYTNHARISSSKHEIRLAFGEIGPTGKLDPKTGVVMSHLAAKGLMAALTRIIDNLEQKVGEIKDPDAASKGPPRQK